MTYSPDGDVVSVTVQEPRFTPEEKALLLMSRRREQVDRRGPHGVLLSEAMDPELQDQWVPVPAVDFVQKRLNAEQKAFREKYGDVMDMDALLWSVKRSHASSES